MKTKRQSYTGFSPIFTGSPSIVTGGFNLNRTAQRFNAGDVIPAGSLAIRDEQTRLVKIVKTAEVLAVDTVDTKIVTLKTGEFYQPTLSVGDSVLKTVSGLFADAPTITKIEKTASKMVITLSAAISGLTAGDTLIEVVASELNAAVIGDANCITLTDTVVREEETSIDVVADTMQYELYERRVLPIPASQRDTTGAYLKANPHIKLTKSF
jgi:hypothetical protein